MKTIQTSAIVQPGHTITLQLPDDIEPGSYRVTLMIDDRPIGPKSDLSDFPAHDVGPWPTGPKSDLKNFPVIDVGPWPEGLSLRREDMYGDDGR